MDLRYLETAGVGFDFVCVIDGCHHWQTFSVYIFTVREGQLLQFKTHFVYFESHRKAIIKHENRLFNVADVWYSWWQLISLIFAYAFCVFLFTIDRDIKEGNLFCSMIGCPTDSIILGMVVRNEKGVLS